jgi:hypothetical protein
VKYFLVGFGGMFLTAIVFFGAIGLLVTYCPIPTGAHKYLVMAGIVTAGMLMIVTISIVGAIALQSE